MSRVSSQWRLCMSMYIQYNLVGVLLVWFYPGYISSLLQTANYQILFFFYLFELMHPCTVRYKRKKKSRYFCLQWESNPGRKGKKSKMFFSGSQSMEMQLFWDSTAGNEVSLLTSKQFWYFWVLRHVFGRARALGVGWGKKIAFPWFGNLKKAFLTFFLSGPGSSPAGDENICPFPFFPGGHPSFLPKLQYVGFLRIFDVSTA